MISPPDALLEDQQYAAALTDGQILIRVCADCSSHFVLPVPGCPDCGSDRLNMIVSSGRGRLYTWTVANYGFSPDLQPDVPYVVGAIELEGAARIFARVEGIEPAQLVTGLSLSATFPGVDERPPVVFVPSELERLGAS